MSWGQKSPHMDHLHEIWHSVGGFLVSFNVLKLVINFMRETQFSIHPATEVNSAWPSSVVRCNEHRWKLEDQHDAMY